MFRQLTSLSNKLVQRYLPDPYLFVVLLTFVVFLFALMLTPSGPKELVIMWGSKFWDLLTFSMQMVLILVTGYVLANSPIFKTLLGKLASIAKSPSTAIILVTFISIVASWINWGFGLVIGALFARELARQVKVDYRLLIASAYSGFVVWHGGLSGSIPLTIATEGHFTQEIIGIIPTSETLFSTFNLVIVFAVAIILPIANRFMYNEKEAVVINPKLLEEPTEKGKFQPVTPAERLENSWLVSVLIGGIGLVFVIHHFVTNGFKLDLNIVNFTFLFLGILFHFRPRNFLQSVQNAVKGASGIIIQFPFYAGIMGMMVSSGLAERISQWFVSISNEVTFPLLAFISAGIVNIFVPSGGGQWAVQAHIMLEAGADLGIAPAVTAMAVAWGDAWTNLIQPFWALPVLAIAGLKAKDIMGFCLINLFVTGIIIGAVFLLF
ncbi:short-chain fatty acids transporter [Thermolongibacillus altinsuensis]|uniref:Short-chain fatty acids transporter n=1 Tax=Thermolongibacillus altinsuensis TaxID=575256 RepID=A0A4R1QIE9_9BACL|nr:short-chain fatty acid transporter [Thermolongibacillus altinsuensis]TCL53266.1 short-chain fatty acids transporter [Thermolongibacillus altinsuensis]